MWRGSIRVWPGSIRLRCGSIRVWRGSIGSASACCMAGPSSILGKASLADRRSDEDTRIKALANDEG